MEGLIPKRPHPFRGCTSPGKGNPAFRVLVPVCLALLFIGGCSVAPSSGDIENDPLSQVTTPRVTEVTETTETTDSSEITDVTETTETLSPDPPETQPTPNPDAAIRFEGSENVRFSGVCSVGDARNVLTGVVPQRFEFRLGGYPLECNIENQSGGTLRVVLVADGDTRSVQQTDGQGGTITVSYSDS